MNKTRRINTPLLFGAALAGAMAWAPLASAEPRTHDGFYMQLDAGLGYLSASQDAGGFSTSIHGLSTPAALVLGGTVGPIVIGGGFFADHAVSPSASVSGPGYSGSASLPDFTMTLVAIGMFADYYVDPHGGLHFQPFVGWGALSRSSGGNTSTNDPTGLVLALGGGYDWWVGDEWSIGVMGRLAYAPLSFSAGGASASVPTIAPALLATFTYH